jgi:hypothetical protein
MKGSLLKASRRLRTVATQLVSRRVAYLESRGLLLPNRLRQIEDAECGLHRCWNELDTRLEEITRL